MSVDRKWLTAGLTAAILAVAGAASPHAGYCGATRGPHR